MIILLIFNGVTRMLQKLRISRGDYWNKQCFSSIASIFKILFAPRGSEFFPLRAVPFGNENHFYCIRWSPLNVTIFIVRNCVMEATPMILTNSCNA